MDLVTGKVQREVFFDPEICLDLGSVDPDWISKNLYVPLPVIQSSDKVVSVSRGEHEPPLELRAKEAKTVHPEQKEGL